MSALYLFVPYQREAQDMRRTCGEINSAAAVAVLILIGPRRDGWSESAPKPPFPSGNLECRRGWLAEVCSQSV